MTTLSRPASAKPHSPALQTGLIQCEATLQSLGTLQGPPNGLTPIRQGSPLTIADGVKVLVLRPPGQNVEVTLPTGETLYFQGNPTNAQLARSNVIRSKLQLPVWVDVQRLTVQGIPLGVQRLADRVNVRLPDGRVLPFAPKTTNQQIARSGLVREAMGLPPTPKAAAPSAAGFNPAASITYSLTGAVASYNILVSSGMTPKQALLQLPAGFARDVINIGISQVPVNIKNPLLEVAFKGGVGGVLTLATNAVAGKVHAPAKVPGSLNAGMVLTAFTVNGSIVTLNEMRKRGYLGGTPPDKPQDAAQWFRKYAPESAAIGVGVTAGMLPAVVAKGLLNGAPLTPGQVLKAAAMMLMMPTLQGLVANAIVNPPAGGWADTRRFPPGTVAKLQSLASNLSSMGSFVLADKVMSVINSLGKPLSSIQSFSAGASVSMAAWVASLQHAVDLSATGVNLIGRDITRIDEARLALAEVDKLLASPFTHMSNPHPALSAFEASDMRDERIAALRAERARILQMHPSLR